MIRFKRMVCSMVEIAAVLAISYSAYWLAWQGVRWIFSIDFDF